MTAKSPVSPTPSRSTFGPSDACFPPELLFSPAIQRFFIPHSLQELSSPPKDQSCQLQPSCTPAFREGFLLQVSKGKGIILLRDYLCFFSSPHLLLFFLIPAELSQILRFLSLNQTLSIMPSTSGDFTGTAVPRLSVKMAARKLTHSSSQVSRVRQVQVTCLWLSLMLGKLF